MIFNFLKMSGMSSFLTRKHDFAKIEFHFFAADVRDLEFCNGKVAKDDTRVRTRASPKPQNRTKYYEFAFRFNFSFCVFYFIKSQNRKIDEVLLKSLPEKATGIFCRARANPKNIKIDLDCLFAFHFHFLKGDWRPQKM